MVCLEYEGYYLMTVYTRIPRLSSRGFPTAWEWEDCFRTYAMELAAKKPLIFVRDLNVAHEPIDLINDKTNHKNAGFTDEERGKMERLLHSGFTDTFRYLYPDKE